MSQASQNLTKISETYYIRQNRPQPPRATPRIVTTVKTVDTVPRITRPI